MPSDSAALGSLELLCFGPPVARLNKETPPADVLWRKHLALLIYLALSPGQSRPREHLIGLLWPEKDQTKARRSFNEALRRLRSSLGAARLLSDGATVTLNSADLYVDALTFDRADADEALFLLQGDFLDGLVMDDAPEFEQWASAQRAQFHARAVELFLEKGETALARSEFVAAETAARRALELSPFAERAVRLIMRSAALAGDSPRALDAFSEFTTKLQTELAEKPSPDLAALSERIRRGVRPQVRDRAESPPLVGRETVHEAVLAECRRGLSAGPRVVIIAGDQGYGKTRLLDECVDRLTLDGALSGVVRPLESDLDTRWSTLRLLLRRELSGAPGVLGTAPELLGVLAGVEPEFAPRATPITPRDDAQVATAFAACVKAITEETPLILGIDDAQFADVSTLAVVRSALQELEAVPLVVVLTASSLTDSTPRELLALRAGLGRSVEGTVAELVPLDRPSIETLIETLAPWCAQPEQRNRLARRLEHETHGNPLFVVTLLRALSDASTLRQELMVWPPPRSTMVAPIPIAVPDAVCSAVVMQVMSLDEPTARVLKAASILGQAVDPAMVEKTTTLSADMVQDALVSLERARLLVDDGSRLAFSAPLIANVVRDRCMQQGERRQLQRRALDALEGRSDLASQVDRAMVLADAGRNDEALKLALATARRALAEGTTRAARRSLTLARGSATVPLAELQELETRLAEMERERRPATNE